VKAEQPKKRLGELDNQVHRGNHERESVKVGIFFRVGGWRWEKTRHKSGNTVRESPDRTSRLVRGDKSWGRTIHCPKENGTIRKRMDEGRAPRRGKGKSLGLHMSWESTKRSRKVSANWRGFVVFSVRKRLGDEIGNRIHTRKGRQAPNPRERGNS